MRQAPWLSPGRGKGWTHRDRAPTRLHRELSALESGRPDLNWRPPAPQAGALPGCATPRDGRGLLARGRRNAMLGQRALAADESLEAKAGATASGVSPRTEGGLLRRKLAPLPLNPPNIRDLAELQFQRMGRLPKTSHFPAISAGGRGTTLAEPTSRSTHVPPTFHPSFRGGSS